jgi:hypothetical protein
MYKQNSYFGQEPPETGWVGTAPLQSFMIVARMAVSGG